MMYLALKRTEPLTGSVEAYVVGLRARLLALGVGLRDAADPEVEDSNLIIVGAFHHDPLTGLPVSGEVQVIVPDALWDGLSAADRGRVTGELLGQRLTLERTVRRA